MLDLAERNPAKFASFLRISKLMADLMTCSKWTNVSQNSCIHLRLPEKDYSIRKNLDSFPYN